MVQPLLLVAGTGKAQEAPQCQSIITVRCLLCLTKTVRKTMVKLKHQEYIALDMSTMEMSLAKLILEDRLLGWTQKLLRAKSLVLSYGGLDAKEQMTKTCLGSITILCQYWIG